jgi:hypothetical protein
VIRFSERISSTQNLCSERTAVGGQQACQSLAIERLYQKSIHTSG